jgi:hypothetical protein
MRSTKYLQKEMKRKEILKALNTHVYFAFLLKGVILNKNESNYILFTSFRIHNITFNKSEETFTAIFPISAE